MIKELFFEIYTYHRQLAGEGAVIVLFAAALLFCVCLFAKRGQRYAAGVLSILSTIGIAASEFFEEALSRIKKPVLKTAAGIFAAAICVLAIASSGRRIFSSEFSEKAIDAMHIPQGMTGAMDAILSDSEEPMVLTMPGWGLFFTSYSSRFQMMYEEGHGGDITSFDEDERVAFGELSDVHPDMKKVSLSARRAGCTYIVTSRDIWPEIPLTKFGYELMYENDNCLVYKEVTTP